MQFIHFIYIGSFLLKEKENTRTKTAFFYGLHTLIGKYYALAGDDGSDDDANEYLYVFATSFHFGLRLLGKANDHVYCHYISQLLTGPGIDGTCGVGSKSNTLKGVSLKRIILGCVVPAFPLGL